MTLVFNKCCGCIELKTGCFIIGYINLIGAIALVIISVLALTAGAVVTGIDDPEHPEYKSAGIIVMIGSGVLLVIAAFLLTFVIVLLVGLHKNKPGHVKAYLIYSVIFLILYLIRFIIVLVGGSTDPGTIIQSLLVLILSTYFTLVLRSMYYRMKDPSRGPAIYSAA